MTGDNEGHPSSPVDADHVCNLDALSRDLADIEALAAAALADHPVDRVTASRLTDAPAGLTYDGLTAHNRQRSRDGSWGEAELADLLDPVALRQLDEWREGQRLPWQRADLMVVGVAGLIGALANLFDTQLDGVVLDGLSWLKRTDLFRGWEKDAARLPIDYTGPKFGGPAHRIRSPGHDIGRFFTALQQVRTGTFEGTWWEDGQRVVQQVTTTRSGLPFTRADDPHLAIALLLKHWAADFVTPMNLPLPGWSLLYELPNRELRKFAHDAYAGTNSGDGLNLRSGLSTPGLGLVATEIIVRTHCHLAAFRETGSARLTSADADKRTEMLLAAHAASGAVSISKTVATALTGGSVLAVRHLNLPVLMRVGGLALQVHRQGTRRKDQAPSWEQLIADDAATWTLPEAIALAGLLD